MGGGGSSSQQSSQATSESRQALYTPSAASIQKSIDQLLGIYQQSTAQLAPFNQTAFDATNDMRYWQGMAGIDPTVRQAAELQAQMETIKAPGKSEQLVNMPGYAYYDVQAGGKPSVFNASQSTPARQISVSQGGGGEQFTNQKLLMSNLTDINQNLTLLSTEQDPEKRQALYDQAMAGFSTFDTTSQDMLKEYQSANSGKAADAYGSNASPGLSMAEHIYYTDPDTGKVHEIPREYALNPANAVTTTPYGAGGVGYGDKTGTGKDTGVSASSDEFLKQVTKIDALKAQVMAQFKKEGNPAPTPEQVLARLQSTPGYTTQLNQGLQAIQNTDIAKGLFGSGRAAKELTRYGQDYAQNALTNQFNRSAQLAGLTLPTVTQQSSNTVAQAAPIMQSTQLAGSSWNMSPWTSKSQSTSQGSSETREGMGGLGSVLGTVLGGIF